MGLGLGLFDGRDGAPPGTGGAPNGGAGAPGDGGAAGDGALADALEVLRSRVFMNSAARLLESTWDSDTEMDGAGAGVGRRDGGRGAELCGTAGACPDGACPNDAGRPGGAPPGIGGALPPGAAFPGTGGALGTGALGPLLAPLVLRNRAPRMSAIIGFAAACGGGGADPADGAGRGALALALASEASRIRPPVWGADRSFVTALRSFLPPWMSPSRALMPPPASGFGAGAPFAIGGGGGGGGPGMALGEEVGARKLGAEDGVMWRREQPVATGIEAHDG